MVPEADVLVAALLGSELLEVSWFVTGVVEESRSVDTVVLLLGDVIVVEVVREKVACSAAGSL